MTGPTDEPLTSMHVRRAVAGDGQSIGWVVQRFTPLLLAQARYRLGRSLRLLHEPSDLANDVWVRVLPHLPSLLPLRERMTPALLSLLSTALLRRVRDLFEKHVKGKPVPLSVSQSPSAEPAGLARDETGVVTAAVQRERQGAVLCAIEELDDLDRQILVLRGIEQRDNKEVAAFLGIGEDAASARWRRALARLRERLPETVVSELAE